MFKIKKAMTANSLGHRYIKYRKAKAPCPRCGSWNTIVENGIFVCLNCDFEG